MKAMKATALGRLQDRAEGRFERQEAKGMGCLSGNAVVTGAIAAAFVVALSATGAAAGTISKNPARASSSLPAAAIERTVTPTAFETAALRLINTYRTQHGLRALAVRSNLYLLSKQHSRHMAATQTLSHDGFDSRYKLSGFSTCVENVAWNYLTATTLIGAWKSSAGHNANLLSRGIRYAGMTRAGAYATFFACG